MNDFIKAVDPNEWYHYFNCDVPIDVHAIASHLNRPSLFGQDDWILASVSVHKHAKKELGQFQPS